MTTNYNSIHHIHCGDGNMQARPLAEVPSIGPQYSPLTGLVFVFNLIVGTGALALPAAFGSAGWMLSLCVIVMLAFMSYMTVTFVIEAMAAANAVNHWQQLQRLKKMGHEPDELISKSLETLDDYDSEETSPLMTERNTAPVTSYFAIEERIEMGKMASMFFRPWGQTLFYMCIIVYLYGDLSIYCAAVSKSLRDLTCTYIIGNGTGNDTHNVHEDLCWPDSSISRIYAYRIYLIFFIVILGPFIFFDIQKTKYLQLFTSLMRWIAFTIMVVLACVIIGKGKGTGHPPVYYWSGLPNLFGVCVYSFMCHHSLPSLVTPISKKNKLFLLFALDYALIAGFYLVVAFTGIFAFEKLYDLYTLNFQPDKEHPELGNVGTLIIQYFLSLFPVFTLSTSFPIIGITLRNNLKSLCLKEEARYSWVLRKVVFPLLACVPPAIIAFATENVQFLVGITGSYAGTGVQYLIPTALVYFSRRTTRTYIAGDVTNPHVSPFQHGAWLVFVLVWSAVSLILVTVDHIIVS